MFTPNMQAFNEAMSSVRVSVEWLFGDVLNSFKFLDFKNNLKLGLSAVGKYYIYSDWKRHILVGLVNSVPLALWLNKYLMQIVSRRFDDPKQSCKMPFT